MKKKVYLGEDKWLKSRLSLSIHYALIKKTPHLLKQFELFEQNYGLLISLQ